MTFIRLEPDHPFAEVWNWMQSENPNSTDRCYQPTDGIWPIYICSVRPITSDEHDYSIVISYSNSVNPPKHSHHMIVPKNLMPIVMDMIDLAINKR